MVKTELIKIVYFDESSAIDYLEISNKGRQISEKTTASSKQGKIGATAGASIGTNSLLTKIISPLLSLDVSAESSTKLAMIGESVVKTSISNTLLSDYIEKAEKDRRLTILTDYTISTTTESFSYIKMAAPYFKLFNLPESKINIDALDQILEAGKGYYELVANNISQNDTKILRFNIRAFRNNYHLVDLTKMKIKIYGVKVGEATLESVKAGQEFNVAPAEVPTLADIVNGENQSSKAFDLIDVVLVGVSHGEN